MFLAVLLLLAVLGPPALNSDGPILDVAIASGVDDPAVIVIGTVDVAVQNRTVEAPQLVGRWATDNKLSVTPKSVPVSSSNSIPIRT